MKHKVSTDKQASSGTEQEQSEQPTPENLDVLQEAVVTEETAQPDEPTTEERIAGLEKDLADAVSANNESLGQIIKLQNKLSTRDEEFTKLAEAYRKLRESVEKIEAQHVAEFDNYRRRTEEEKKRIGDKAVADVMLGILPTLDNFDRALRMLDSANDIATVRDGVTMIVNGLRQALEAQGLERLTAVGTEFNPEFHNAVATMETNEHPEGHVADEMMPGYSLNGTLIRPAMVRVARAPEDK